MLRALVSKHTFGNAYFGNRLVKKNVFEYEFKSKFLISKMEIGPKDRDWKYTYLILIPKRICSFFTTTVWQTMHVI